MEEDQMPERTRPKKVDALIAFLKANEPIDLGNLFTFFQLMVEAMETRYRWETRSRGHLKAKSRGKGRQLFRERVSQHCYKTGFLAALMAEIEHRAGSTDLDSGRLILAGLVHDIPELLGGDKYYWQKTEKDEKSEQSGFDALTAHFSPELCTFLRDVYMITQPDQSKPYHEWTREQRFFKLVELVGYFKRTLAECRAGNYNFASVFKQHWGRGFPHDPLAYEKEFPATIAYWFPQNIREEIEQFAARAE